jgi:hypothetical protein
MNIPELYRKLNNFYIDTKASRRWRSSRRWSWPASLFAIRPASSFRCGGSARRCGSSQEKEGGNENDEIQHD